MGMKTGPLVTSHTTNTNKTLPKKKSVNSSINLWKKNQKYSIYFEFLFCSFLLFLQKVFVMFMF